MHALVCTSCGAEVALLSNDDIAALESLPEHRCQRRKRAA